MVLAASRKNRVKLFKVATLQRQAHLQPCNVPFSGSNKVWWRVQRAPFQRCSLPLGERKTCLQVAFLIDSPVKSAFALLLTRVTEPRKNYLQEIGGVTYEKNNKRNGR